MGRWLSRDPIGESGGKNIYGFVNNDGVNRWDRLGLEWLINREGKARATACPSKRSDTISDLARDIRLDANEFREWARDIQGNRISGLPKPGQSLTIPNSVVVAHGAGTPWFTQSMMRQAQNYQNRLQEEKYKVLFYGYNAGDNFRAGMRNPDVFGFAFFGHGDEEGFSLANDLGIKRELYRIYLAKQEELLSAGASMAEIRKYVDLANAVQTSISTEEEQTFITPSVVANERPFKSSYLIIFACAVNANRGWDGLHSKRARTMLPIDGVPVMLPKQYYQYYSPLKIK